MRMHLAHDLSAVDLYGALRHAEFGSDALVCVAGDYQGHDFALALGERGEALLQPGDGRRRLALQAVALDARVDGVEQLLIAERLAQELDRPRLDRAHRHRDVAVAGNEDDGKMDARLRQLLLEREAARARQSHVEHEAARGVGALRLQELLRRSEYARLETDGGDKILDGVAHRRVVVDDEHDRS